MTAATDPMGQAARRASLLTDALGRQLLGASSNFATREERRACLELVFEVWPKVTRAMAELERVAPVSADAGASQDGKHLDWLERRS